MSEGAAEGRNPPMGRMCGGREGAGAHVQEVSQETLSRAQMGYPDTEYAHAPCY